MTTQQIVKKANSLVNAAYSVTLAEQRLILLAIVRAEGDAAALQDLAVRASDYAQQYGVTLPTAYESLQDASANLFERRFSYQRITEQGHVRDVVTRWVSRIEYGAAEGLVTLRFADDLLPLLCDLRERFTYYALEQIADLTSIYAVRLYELMMAWRSTGRTPVIEVADLRQRLGVEDHEYARMTDFKRRVLNFAVEQVNEYTDITASYQQHKRGRSISGFEFSFKPKAAPAKAGDDKPKRQKITKRQAEAMAHPGESYRDLYKRLSRDYIIAEGA